MLYHIFYPFSRYLFAFNVFKYITFRSTGAFISAFLLVLCLWKITVGHLTKLKIQEKIDMYGHVHLETLHGSKEGTPTMGGILILAGILASVFLWSRFDNRFVWYTVGVGVLLGILGFCDDYLKTARGKGLTRMEKLLCQTAVGILLGVVAFLDPSVTTRLDVPFLKNIVWNLGILYIGWAALIIIATSNAVNFTDGLDGLAVGAVVTNCLVFAILSYLTGHARFAQYLFIPFIPEAGELTVVCAAIAGAGLGFLWFNAYPAQIFMGDVGALALGGMIGVMAVFIKKEFLLVISGGIFAMEALSVVLQIVSVRLCRRRIFKAAPFHHHLQILGWTESKIVVRLWILSIIFALLSLVTLKLR